MSVNKFKVGDVVKCVDTDAILSITVGKEYVVLAVNNRGNIAVENDIGDIYYYYPSRFELSGANAQQTHKFKVGDMVYLIGFVLATEDNRQMLNRLLGVEYEPVKLTGSD